MPKKYNYAVLHVQSGRFVNRLGENKSCYWEAGEPAKLFSKSVAQDIAYGLTFNGFTSLVVEVPVYVQDLRNKADEGENNG